MSSIHSYQHSQQRRRHLKEFQHKAQMLLTDADQEYLYTVLREFQMSHQVDKLVKCLRSLLDTPAKLDLLKDIRNFIPSAYAQQYDRLAPYHKMAHPFRVPNTVRTNVQLPKYHSTGSLNRPSKPKVVVEGPVDGKEGTAAVKVVTVVKDSEENLGFSIRGGSEHGLGIYVSQVEAGSSADQAGLQVGDNVLEVNCVSFDNLASSSAVKVLTGSSRLKMIVRRVGKIPVFRHAKEKTSWFDVAKNRVVEGSLEDHGTVHHPVGLGFLDGIVERRINMSFNSGQHFLGFNIRGGSEYGLGTYVSRVDTGGLADHSGLKVGDQVMEVNGQDFDNITHANAVEFLRSQVQLIMTVRDVGRYPAFKEIYAEYSWIEGNGVVTRTNGTSLSGSEYGTIVHTGPYTSSVSMHPRSQSPDLEIRQPTITHFPESRVESLVESFTQTMELEQPESPEIGIQTDVVDSSAVNMFLPHTRDVVLRERPLPPPEPVKVEKSKKDHAPKSTVGVMALQMSSRQNNPEWITPSADTDLRQVTNQETSLHEKQVKKSRTLKDVLFGSLKVRGEKNRGGSLSLSSRTKTRRPLSGISFGGKKEQKSQKDVSNGSTNGTEAVFVHGLGSQLMLQGATQQAAISMIEDSAQKLLNEDEVAAILRHVKRYQQERDVESLVSPLLAILDKPEKIVLLRDIRSIIHPSDIGTFDSLVSRQELQAYEELASKVGKTSPSGGNKKKENTSPSHTTSVQVHQVSRQQSYQEIVMQQRQAKISKLRQEREAKDTSGIVPFEKQLVVDDDDKVIKPSANSNHVMEIHRRMSHSKVYTAVVSDVDIRPTNQLSPAHDKPSQTKVTNQMSPTCIKPSQAKVTNQLANTNVILLSNRTINPASSTSAKPLQEQAANYVSSTFVKYSTAKSEEHETPVKNGAVIPQNGGVQVSRGDDMSLYNSSTTSSQTPSSSGISEMYAMVDREMKRGMVNGVGYIDSSDFNPVYEEIRPVESFESSSVASPSAASTPKHSNDLSGTAAESRHALDSVALPTALQTVQETSEESIASGLSTSSLSSLSTGLSFNSSTEPVLLSSFKKRDEFRTESPATAAAVESLGFLDALEIDCDSELNNPLDADSLRDSPHTDGSSSGSSSPRYGSYDIGPKRAPPTFFAPPPPMEPPPADDEDIDLDGWVTEEITPLSSPMSSPRSMFSANWDAGNTGISARATRSWTLPHEPNTEIVPRKEQVDVPQPTHNKPITVKLHKRRSILGVSISGGKNSRTQPEIRIDQIFEGGAAHDTGMLEPGMKVLSIDGHSVEDATHLQAVNLIRRSYINKEVPTMDIVVCRP